VIVAIEVHLSQPLLDLAEKPATQQPSDGSKVGRSLGSTRRGKKVSISSYSKSMRV
jgi:hypothetical protein